MDLLTNDLSVPFSDDENLKTKLEDKLYKDKYRTLKRTLMNAVNKNEYLKSELRHGQKKLQVCYVNSFYPVSLFLLLTMFQLLKVIPICVTVY